jgi:4-hydroxybenzoate polyprenyltransferase
MLRGTKAFVRKLGDHTLPFLILGVIGAAFAIAFVFEAGPAVVFAVLVMGCFAAVMESTGIRTEHRRAPRRGLHAPQQNIAARCRWSRDTDDA